MPANENTANRTAPATLAQKLALYSEILRDCSVNGLHYSETIYDRERYQRIQDVALELHALATGQNLEQVEPLRATIFARPAPMPSVDAAIIDEAGSILLIRRADNSLWAMPGGAVDVGETPAEGAIREALEETGVTSEAVALVAVNDSRFCGTHYPHQLYQLQFLCRVIPGIAQITPSSHAHEILEQGWFAEDELPIDLDPGHRQRIPEAFRVWRGDTRAFFDV